MKLGSFDLLVRALGKAGVRYLVAERLGRPGPAGGPEGA